MILVASLSGLSESGRLDGGFRLRLGRGLGLGGLGRLLGRLGLRLRGGLAGLAGLAGLCSAHVCSPFLWLLLLAPGMDACI